MKTEAGEGEAKSEGQKQYVHIEETSRYNIQKRIWISTLGGPALIFQTFHFLSSIAPNTVHILTLKWV